MCFVWIGGWVDRWVGRKEGSSRWVGVGYLGMWFLVFVWYLRVRFGWMGDRWMGGGLW